MKLSNLSFIVTDNCNFNCSYCIQKKEKNSLSLSLIKETIDFFFPFLNNETNIIFYGGEPLLAFQQIQYTVDLISKKNKKQIKKIKYFITTNGSLITKEILVFFNNHQFNVTLSFDGLSQEKSRRKNSFKKMISRIKQFQEYPNIDFEINSVFTPHTIKELFSSLNFMINLGVPNITFNLSSIERWNPSSINSFKIELKKLVDFMVNYYKKNGKIPIKNFQDSLNNSNIKKGIFQCSAGTDHISITPKGKIWGCFLFHDYFKTHQDHPQHSEYSFGDLKNFKANFETKYQKISANYSELRQDLFKVENNCCFLCQDMSSCSICPVYAAYNTHSIGQISCQHCQLNKILLYAKKDIYSIRNIT